MLWRKNTLRDTTPNLFGEDDTEENREAWTVYKYLRSGLDQCFVE